MFAEKEMMKLKREKEDGSQRGDQKTKRKNHETKKKRKKNSQQIANNAHTVKKCL